MIQLVMVISAMPRGDRSNQFLLGNAQSLRSAPAAMLLVAGTATDKRRNVLRTG